MLKPVQDLNLGFSDAQNYTQRGNKQMLSEVFVKNSYLAKLLQPHVYYLIGEKGTGKTAYAAFLSNAEYEGNKSIYVHRRLLIKVKWLLNWFVSMQRLEEIVKTQLNLARIGYK